MISIVIPNFNGEALLKKNLPKVFDAAVCFAQKEKKTVEVIIIDDCSKDNSIEVIQSSEFRVKSSNTKLTIIKNNKNIRFAASVNKGVKQASGDIVVLLNTDVVPQKDFLEPLVAHFKNQNMFAVGCMDKSVEGDKVVLRGRGLGKWERGLLVHRRGEIDKSNTLWVNGGSGAFRRDIWEKLGGFNTLYAPFYCEDIDLSYRALKSGYQTVFEPKSIVIHEHEKGAIKAKYSAQEVKTIAYKNQFLFVWLNITDTNLLLNHFFWLPYYFLFFAYKMETAFFLGFLRALSLFPLVLIFRFRNKKNFINKDNEVLKMYSDAS